MEQGNELSIPRLDESGVPMEEGPPFAGGWGYTRETACIITDDREPDGRVVSGRDFEALFIRHRLCAELGNAGDACAPLANIRWCARSKALHRHPDGTPAYDQFTVEMRAFPAAEYQALLAEEAALDGEGMNWETRSVLRSRMASKELSHTADCWFDVSCVKGIADDDGFTMQVLRGRLASPSEQEALWVDSGARPSAS